MARASNGKKDGSSELGFEARLWAAADALRNNMDAAEYKHVVLGLIFLKYISDAFEAKHVELEAQRGQGADPEDPDEYRAVSIFWVPPEARWQYLKSMAPQPTIGRLVDDAMTAIERDNVSLKGVLPKDYARPGLDKQRLGQIINLVSDIGFDSPRPPRERPLIGPLSLRESTRHPSPPGRGTDGEGRAGVRVDRAKDTLGRVYEYFLARFASAEGKSGGQFYTPTSVVRVLVEMLAPISGQNRGRVYDPCCGSGGMFVSSEEFIEAHGGRRGDISIFGQESNYTTWRLAKMNLAIRAIEANLGDRAADTFHNDLHPDLKADYVLANPPFNDSDWRGDLLKDDKRWIYGVPPAGNANFAWVQHFIHHLAPTGLAGFVLANGSMSSNQSGEGEIRKAIIEADLVDCMVALPGQLFYSTQIPVCLWFLARDKSGRRSRAGGNPLPSRDRRGETLFLDARKLGSMTDRTHRELTEADLAKIAGTYHAWRGDHAFPPLPPGAFPPLPPGEGRGQAVEFAEHALRPASGSGMQAGTRTASEGEGTHFDRNALPEESALPPPPLSRRPLPEGEASKASAYSDIPGFCKSATLEDIRKHGHVLTPGRYVGAEAAEDDGEPFDEKMKRLTATLRQQQVEAEKLDQAIRSNLEALGFPLETNHETGP